MAISSKRSSYGKDVLDQLLFRRLSTGQVHDPQSFFQAAAKTPQTFNSFYIDNKHVAEYTSGRLPIRPRPSIPGLPAVGTGQYEWQGFLADDKHIHGTDPTRRDDDQLEQHLRPRVRRRGRQLGRQRLGCPGGPAGPQPASA